MSKINENPNCPIQNELQQYIWSKPFAIKSQGIRPQSKLSSYEKLSFMLLGSSWGILILVVTCLHFVNSHLETKTSSTSGSHSSFSK